jgi:Tripeptidyl peptidase II
VHSSTVLSSMSHQSCDFPITENDGYYKCTIAVHSLTVADRYTNRWTPFIYIQQIYELILEYPFSQSESGDVTPRVEALNGYLYESPLLSQMCMVFDASKALQGTCDAWPKPIKYKKVCACSLCSMIAVTAPLSK